MPLVPLTDDAGAIIVDDDGRPIYVEQPIIVLIRQDNTPLQRWDGVTISVAVGEVPNYWVDDNGVVMVDDDGVPLVWDSDVPPRRQSDFHAAAAKRRWSFAGRREKTSEVGRRRAWSFNVLRPLGK